MRNNEKRLGTASNSAPSPAGPTMAFAAPTEFVELPSSGKFYPEGHPLHKQKTIEIRFMTAKDEDILSSQALLKNGLVMDRLIESLSVLEISADSLLLGDRSAILVAARISGYGSDYLVGYNCQECFNVNEVSFDLNDHTLITGCFDQKYLESNNIRFNEDTQTFDFELPTTGVQIGVGLVTGAQEKALLDDSKEDRQITSLLSNIIVKVNQNTDPHYVMSFIDVLPAKDSKFIRTIYPNLVPGVKMEHEFECKKCLNAQTKEVPLTAEFFWPK